MVVRPVSRRQAGFLAYRAASFFSGRESFPALTLYSLVKLGNLRYADKIGKQRLKT
jgi:hypothetical protein